MFSADSRWVQNRKKQINEFSGEKFVAIADPGSDRIPGVCYLMRGRQAGLHLGAHRRSDECVNIQGTSGFGALNLAVLKGARKIYLLGFDYNQSSQHWYENYAWQTPDKQKDDTFLRWAEDFNLAAVQLEKLGTQVFNACPQSVITSFPKISLEELYGQHILR